MQNKKLVFFLLLQFSIFATFAQAGTLGNKPTQHPFYVGAMGGYGSTTWEGLVPSQQNQNSAVNLSTPIQVNEGGGVWGVFAGYELIPNFAFEVSYMRYPNATVTFDAMSLFSFNNGMIEFVTRTESFNFMGKIMLLIPDTKVRAYSSAGVTNVHRSDILNDDWRLNPTFGAGLNFHFTEHVMGEIGGNYTAGYGESNLNPTDSYFPFLYSVTFRLAYCF